MRSLIIKLMTALGCVATLMFAAQRMFDATSGAAASMEIAVKSIKNLFSEISSIGYKDDSEHKNKLVIDNYVDSDKLRLISRDDGKNWHQVTRDRDNNLLSLVRNKAVVRERPGAFSDRVYVYNVGHYLRVGLECNKEKWCFVSDPEKGIVGYTESENLTIGISR